MAVKTFTDNTVLTADDTNTYLNNGGLVYVSTTTVGSAVTSVTVSNAFSSTYDNYRILVQGITGSSASDLRLTFGATTTAYYGSYTYVPYTTGTTAVFGQNNTANLYIGGVATSDEQTLSLDCFFPNATKKTGINGMAYGNTYSFWFSGVLFNSTSYTAFTIATGAGTMTGGTITVYGYRKA
jgi:hypothetical protein